MCALIVPQKMLFYASKITNFFYLQCLLITIILQIMVLC